MDRLCFLTFLLGVTSVIAFPYEEGPPASIYGLPGAQEFAVVSASRQGSYETKEAPFKVPASPSPAPVPQPPQQVPVRVAVFESPASVPLVQEVTKVRTPADIYGLPKIVTEVVSTPTSPPQLPQFIASAHTSASYNAAPGATEFSSPAEMYGAPAVVTDIVIAPPPPPEMPRIVAAVSPPVVYENIAPLPPPSPKVNTPSEIYGPPALVQEFVTASPSQSEIRKIDGPALPPAPYAPFEISIPSQAVVQEKSSKEGEEQTEITYSSTSAAVGVQTPTNIYGVPAVVQQIVAASPPQPEIHPIEGPAPLPAPIAPYEIPILSEAVEEEKSLAEVYHTSAAVAVKTPADIYGVPAVVQQIVAASTPQPQIRPIESPAPLPAPISPYEIPILSEAAEEEKSLGEIDHTSAALGVKTPADIYAVPAVVQQIVAASPPQPEIHPIESPAPLPAPIAPYEIPILSEAAEEEKSLAEIDHTSAAVGVKTPADIYGVPAVVQQIVAASPPQPEIHPTEGPAPLPAPIAPYEIPILSEAVEEEKSLAEIEHTSAALGVKTPADIYGVPAVVQQIVAASPPQPQIRPIESPAPLPAPIAPYEIPILSEAVEEEKSLAEIEHTSTALGVKTPADIYGVPAVVQQIVAASPPQPQIRPIESPAPLPAPIAPYEIPTLSKSVIETKSSAETYSTSAAVIEVAVAQQSVPEVRPLAPTPPAEVPASPPQLPAVYTPSEVYGPPDSENEIVPAPPSPPETPNSEVPAVPARVYGPPVKEEMSIAPPYEPLSLGREIPTKAPKELPKVYSSPLLTKTITKTIFVAPRQLLTLRPLEFPKIKIGPWTLPFGSPASVYGLPSHLF